MSSSAPHPDALELVRERLPKLPRALRRVGQLIIERPEWVVRAPVHEIADGADVSPPTIVRFCHELGYGGLREFKLLLAQRLAVGTPNQAHDLEQETGAGTLLRTIYADTQRQLEAWVASVDAEALDQAISALASADRIDCYGVGNTSMFLARDAQSRLVRLGKNAHEYFDPHMQLYSAATLHKGDAVLAISHVGRQSGLLEAVTMASNGEATVIGLTQRNTPLARRCGIVLPILLPNDASVRMGVEANACQMLLIEAIVVGVRRKLGLPALDHLERFTAVLAARDKAGADEGADGRRPRRR